MNGYKSIPRSEVPEWLRETAERAIVEAAQIAGIPTPALRWHTGPGHMLGWVDEDDPATVHLVVDVMVKSADVYTAKARVFHEVAHCRQFQTMRGYGSSKRDREKDANEFACRNTGFLADNLESWEYD